MANVSRPNGFRAVKHQTGAPYNGQLNMYFMPAADATNCFIGDIVKLTGSSDAQGVSAVTTITAVADVPVGVVVGFAFNPANLNIRYRPASTAQYVYVADSPDLIFEAQDNGTTAATDAGQNAQPLIAAGSTTTANSAFQIDATTKATTNTHMLKLLRVVNRPDVEIGLNGRFEVEFNRHQYANQIAGV